MKKQTTTIEIHLTPEDLIKEGLSQFKDLSEVAIKEERFSNNTIVGFIAGYQAGLHAVGIPHEESIQIGLAISKIIKKLLEDGCGECKKKAKAKK